MRILAIFICLLSVNISKAALLELRCIYRDLHDGANKEINVEFIEGRIAKMEFDTEEFHIYASAITGVRNFEFIIPV